MSSLGAAAVAMWLACAPQNSRASERSHAEIYLALNVSILGAVVDAASDDTAVIDVDGRSLVPPLSQFRELACSEARKA